MQKDPRKVIYVEIDEEVTSVFDRIKRIRKKEILLVIPKKAILFQSSVNLKILKSKMAQKGKRLVIVTTDKKGKHLAEKMGLKVMSRIEVQKNEATPEESLKMKIQPIQARRNEVEEDERPKRFREKKMTIRELVESFKGKESTKGNSGLALQLKKPSRKFLILIIAVSTGLFGLITYIALPSATIYVKPKFDHIDHTVNVTLVDKRKNQKLIQENQPHVISGEYITTTTKQTKIFNTTSQEFNGENAKGTLRIVNTANEEWQLKKGTRFQTEDEGLIFRTTEGVFVPPRIRDETGDVTPGTLVVRVVADPFDAYAKPIGERGNIPASKFIIPGLTKYNQRLIWGESDEPMAGGITSYRKIVMEDDIEAAKKQIEDNLILMAKEDLKTHLDEINQLNQLNLILLDDQRNFETELIDLKISDDLEGSYKDKFELFAEIEARGFAFDFDQLYALLKKELEGRAHPEMRLKEESITPENLVYEVMEEDPLLGQIRITATIKGIEEFAIDASTDAGRRFGDEVKAKVKGLSVEEAEKLLSNFAEVDAVEIKPWPIWIDNLPRIPESLDIKLMKDS